MGVTDAYATVDEYKARVGKTTSGDDTVLAAQLLTVSRQIDKECERFFGQDAAAVDRLYDGNGLTRLYVDDIASLTELAVKVDLDGDWDFGDTDEVLTKDTHFWLGPVNADKGSEPGPWRCLDIIPGNGRLSLWPERPRSVQVTALFGWPAVPGAVKELTVYMTRDWRARLESGPTLMLEDSGAQVRLSPETFLLLRDVKRQYGRVMLFA
jgi:hypothetical protein